jgi:FIMAH domain-containing protein
VDQGVLNAGQGNSLVGKLQDAQAALDAGDTQTAVEHLNAFINEVDALRNAGILDSSQAGILIAMAQAVIVSISG